jgi:hypothetical protein
MVTDLRANLETRKIGNLQEPRIIGPAKITEDQEKQWVENIEHNVFPKYELDRRDLLRGTFKYITMGAVFGLLMVLSERTGYWQAYQEVRAVAPPGVTLAPDWIDYASLTSDPSLSVGREWFRSDVRQMGYSPDGVVARYLSPEQSVSYVVFIDAADSNKIKARNGSTGAIDYSGSDLATVLNNAIANISSNGTGTVVLIGNLPLASSVNMASNVEVINKGVITVTADVDAFIFNAVNYSSFSGGQINTSLTGGTYTHAYFLLHGTCYSPKIRDVYLNLNSTNGYGFHFDIGATGVDKFIQEGAFERIKIYRPAIGIKVDFHPDAGLDSWITESRFHDIFIYYPLQYGMSVIATSANSSATAFGGNILENVWSELAGLTNVPHAYFSMKSPSILSENVFTGFTEGDGGSGCYSVQYDPSNYAGISGNIYVNCNMGNIPSSPNIATDTIIDNGIFRLKLRPVDSRVESQLFYPYGTTWYVRQIIEGYGAELQLRDDTASTGKTFGLLSQGGNVCLSDTTDNAQIFSANNAGIYPAVDVNFASAGVFPNLTGVSTSTEANPSYAKIKVGGVVKRIKVYDDA